MDRRDWALMFDRIAKAKETWVVAIVLSTFAIIGDVKNTLEQGGIDFRNRVVGARLLLAGKDPYTYAWKPGEPEEFLDPSNPPGGPTRCTVPPSVLATIYAPFSSIHYRYQRFLWLGVQWACFAALTGLLLLLTPPGNSRRLILLLMAALFVSDAWRMLVEKGQVYVVYALALSLVWWIGRADGNRTDWPAGLLLGITVALRPMFVLTIIPFAVARRWRVLGGIAAGLFAGVAVTLFVTDFSHWSSFLSTMDAIGRFYVYPEEVPQWWTYPDAYPQTIEGMRNLAVWRGGDPDSANLFKLYRWIPSPHGPTLLKISCAATLGAVCWFVFRRWRSSVGFGTCLIAGVLLACIADFFIPAPRNAYNSILWVVPLGILFVEQWESPITRGTRGLLLIASLALANGVLPACRYDPLGFGSVGVIVCLTLACAALGQQPSVRSENNGVA